MYRQSVATFLGVSTQRQKPLSIKEGLSAMEAFGLYSVPVVDEMVGPSCVGMRHDRYCFFEEPLGHVHP